MTQLRYAIIGTGAIGGYYGARLRRAECDVHFLLRSDYEHVRKHGLVVESIDGDFALSKVNAYRDPSDIPPVDVAIVAIKTTQNYLLPKLLPALKPGGAILSLQNGLSIEDEISQQLVQQFDTLPTILGGLCFICASKVARGHIRHLDYSRLLIGAHNSNHQGSTITPLMENIVADFTKANLVMDTTKDLPMARWKKLVWNVPFNGLSVVLDAMTDEMMTDDGVRSLITTLMREVITVANAWGEHTSPGTQRNLSFDWVDKMLAQTEAMRPYRTSMKIDYDEGRPLETKAILGNPIQVANALSVPIPAMQTLHQQLAFLNRRNISKNQPV